MKNHLDQKKYDNSKKVDEINTKLCDIIKHINSQRKHLDHFYSSYRQEFFTNLIEFNIK